MCAFGAGEGEGFARAGCARRVCRNWDVAKRSRKANGPDMDTNRSMTGRASCTIPGGTRASDNEATTNGSHTGNVDNA